MSAPLQEHAIAYKSNVRKVARIMDENDVTVERAVKSSQAVADLATFIIAWLNWQTFLHKLDLNDDTTFKASSSHYIFDTMGS